MSDYFEKKRGILWAILTIILFLFAFGGFDLLFKLKIGEIMQVPITQLTFLMLIIAFVIVLVVGIIIWVFSVLKTQHESKDTLTLFGLNQPDDKPKEKPSAPI